MGWRELVLMTALLMLCKAVSIAMQCDVSETLLVRGIVMGPAGYCAVFLLAVVSGFAAGIQIEGWELVFGYTNVRFLNHSQTVIIPLLAGILGLTGLGQRWRYIAWFALCMNFALLILTRGRATMVALSVIAFVAALAFGRPGRHFARRLLFAVVIGVAVHVLVFEVLAEWLIGVALRPAPLQEASSIEARLFLWKRALSLVAESPWLGAGPMHFAFMPDRPPQWDLLDAAAHPHNIYLQLAAEYGLPATTIFLATCLSAFARRFGTLRNAPEASNNIQPLALAAGFACVAAAIDGLFSGNFVMPTSQIWIALAAGVFLARPNAVASVEAVAVRGTVQLRAFVMPILLASQIWLLTVMVTEWRSAYTGKASGHHEVTAAGAVEQPADIRHPRFWLNGWF